MFSRITRLELVIVVGALLLLVFFTRPPTSGNADIRPAPLPAGTDAGQMSRDTPSATTTAQPGSLPSSEADPVDGSTADSDTAALTIPPPPKVKRVGIVDARNCTDLNYKDVMYGEVKVHWVWNGQKFEARKVLEVKEANGVTSIWTFDENDNIVTKEIRPEQAPEN